jgi:hypothetical protein
LQRRIVLEKDNLKLKNNEILFSLTAVEARKASPIGDFHSWNPKTDLIHQIHENKFPDPPVVTKMIPCFPCTWG